MSLETRGPSPGEEGEGILSKFRKTRFGKEILGTLAALTIMGGVAHKAEANPSENNLNVKDKQIEVKGFSEDDVQQAFENLVRRMEFEGVPIDVARQIVENIKKIPDFKRRMEVIVNVDNKLTELTNESGDLQKENIELGSFTKFFDPSVSDEEAIKIVENNLKLGDSISYNTVRFSNVEGKLMCEGFNLRDPGARKKILELFPWVR